MKSNNLDSWTELSRRVLDGKAVSREQALAMLESADDDLLSLLSGAFAIRRQFFGNGVILQVIKNARSGRCSENCAYCSQSSASDSPVNQYPLQTADQIMDGAREAFRLGAKRYCIVTGGRAPGETELAAMCDTARRIKAELHIDICVSLGLLTTEQAGRLRDAGVDRYNHNLETSARYYPRICTTHSWDDRFATARAVKAAGMQLCSGGIIGIGESLEDRVELAFALKAVSPDSIPVNFLDPRPGTRLSGHPQPSATDSLRALAMFRFVHPDTELRMAGGRERCLGPMQVMALYAANSMFTSGYLTTPGQGYEADAAMIEAAGFHIARVEHG